MKKSSIAMLAAAGVSAMMLGLATPAASAPQDAVSAQDKVNELEAEGYEVIVTKSGHASLDQCTVAAVRPGQEFYVHQPMKPPGQGVTYALDRQTIYVDARC